MTSPGPENPGLPVPATTGPFNLIDVPSGRSTSPSARGHLARLVAVLGVLVGLVFLQGSPCSDHIAASHCPAAEFTGVGISAISGTEVAMLDQVESTVLAPLGLPDAPTGVIELCLSLLVAVLLMLVGLTRPGSIRTPSEPSWLPNIAMPSRRGAPGLAMLCVLRT